jgi:hypothetical protein
MGLTTGTFFNHGILQEWKRSQIADFVGGSDTVASQVFLRLQKFSRT